jgi:hypothetical protein
MTLVDEKLHSLNLVVDCGGGGGTDRVSWLRRR